MSGLPFAKGQALGNDYLVLDAANLPWRLTPARTRALCDRHRGIGSDGILLGDVSRRPFGLRIYNPDGSEAEKSGNGLRIFGAYLYGWDLVADERFAVRLVKDEVTMRVEAVVGGGLLQIVADMGPASFRGVDAGFRPRPDEVRDEPLELEGGETVRVQPVSLANPHCVVFVDELRRDVFLRQAPQLATHAAFPAGTNVQFARVEGPASLEAWIYERGVGETLASGSSACAVAAAARRHGMTEADPIVVRMPGGSVEIEGDPGRGLRLRGPAQIVYQGRLTAGVVEALGQALSTSAPA